MAKGDSKRIQDTQQQTQQDINAQRQRTSDVSNQFQNAFNQANQQQNQERGDIFSKYQDIYNRPDITMSPQYKSAIDQSMGQYGNFAQTGGFSPQDIQNIRARSVAPTRGMFQRGQEEIDRQARIGGAPNAIAAKAKMGRDMGQSIADANTNANAQIAQMVQQGKLAGMAGQTGIAGQQLGLQNNIDQQNLARLMGATEGMRGLYGTNPAMASQFGNQLLSSLGLTGDIANQGMKFAGNQSDIQQQHQPWWKQALSIGGTVAPFFTA